MPSCTADAATCGLLNKIIVVIFNPILVLLTAVAVLLFVWGAASFIWNLRSGQPSKEGKKHMAFGLLGLFIIIATFAILNVISNTVKGFFH